MSDVVLPPWPQVARPDEDILGGRFDESVFAAKLADVHFAATADPDYQDPERFFRKTALTRGLREFLTEVIKRLAGTPNTEPVIDLLTSFGGGKTHAMIAARHLAVAGRDAGDWPGVGELLNDAKLRAAPNADVAVLVGDYLDPRDGTDGRLTMWGEMAFQLAGKDGYVLMEGHDRDRMAPTSKLLAEVLQIGSTPKLILIDELVHYVSVARARSVAAGGSSLATQTYNFIRALSEAATKVPNCCLVSTLPASVLEMGKEDVEDYGRLRKVLHREGAARPLAEGEEIYDIVRRRLFDEPRDSKALPRVAASFLEYYRAHPGSFPDYASTAEYSRRIERAYPFHPCLLDLFSERWASIPEFQRTRGVLRLLALLVGALYREDSRPLILPASAKLSFADFRAEALHQAAADAQFPSVVESDIAGTGARARVVDERGNETYQREHIAEGVATSVLLYSFGGGAQIGASLAEVRLATCRPGLEPAFVSDAVDLLHKRALHYMHEDAGRYHFSVTPNLTAVRVSFEENIPDDEIARKIAEVVEAAVGSRPFRVLLFPEMNEVPDQPALSLVVGPLDKTLDDGGRAWATDVIKGTGGYRVHKNAVCVLVPHAADELWTEVRSLLALQGIERVYGKAKEFRESQRRDLEQLLADARLRVPQAVWGAYRHVLCASAEDEPEHFDLGRQVAREGTSVAQAVWDRLADEQRLAATLGPSQLVAKELWPEDRDRVCVAEVADAFTRYPYLPMVPGPDEVLRAVARGVADGVFGYGIGDGEQFDRVWLGQSIEVEISPSAWLIRREVARQLVPHEGEDGEVEPVPPPPPPRPGPEDEEPAATYRVVRGRGSLGMARWREFYAEVIRPLVDAGAEVKIDVSFEAQATPGVPADTVDLVVRENLRQNYAGDVETERTDDSA